LGPAAWGSLDGAGRDAVGVNEARVAVAAAGAALAAESVERILGLARGSVRAGVAENPRAVALIDIVINEESAARIRRDAGVPVAVVASALTDVGLDLIQSSRGENLGFLLEQEKSRDR